MQLRGMTWAHDRGLAPLRATAAEWHRRTGVAVDWQVRSLKDFGEVPLADLVDDFDLLVLDHPFIARAADGGLAVALDDLVGPDYLAAQAAGSIGGSHESYRWGDRQWALAIDAAAQVMACRPDLLPGPPPATWAAVLDHPAVGMPMNATDVVPTFLTLCASLGERPFAGDRVVSPGHGETVLLAMRRLARVAVPWTLDGNPIEVLERMAAGDEVAVVPAAFGYTNYARPGYRRHRLTFHDLPAVTPGGPPAGSTLGGAGLAVSGRSRHPREAVDHAMFVAAPETQRGPYVEAGGQPAHRSAWDDPAADRTAGGFLTGTRATMDHAVVRPRHAGYLDWQDGIGPVLAEFVRGDAAAAPVLAEIERQYARCLTALLEDP